MVVSKFDRTTLPCQWSMYIFGKLFFELLGVYFQNLGGNENVIFESLRYRHRPLQTMLMLSYSQITEVADIIARARATQFLHQRTSLEKSL